MSTGKKKNTAETVRELVSPLAESMGIELWDVEYVKEGADMYLRFTIDRDGGVGIEDCERWSRAVDPMLDEADPIEGPYYLEVSSPGVERTLTRDEHVARMAGSEVEVKLFSPVDGKRSVTGILKGRDGEAVTLETGDGEVRLDRAAVAKVTTVFHWN